MTKPTTENDSAPSNDRILELAKQITKERTWYVEARVGSIRFVNDRRSQSDGCLYESIPIHALIADLAHALIEAENKVEVVKAQVLTLAAQARDAYRKGGPVWRAARDAASRYTVFTAEQQDIADDVCARLLDGALRLTPILAACNRASVGSYEGPRDDAAAVEELRHHLRLTGNSIPDAVAALGALADKVRKAAKQLQPPQEWRSIAACWDVVEAALPRWRAVTETEPAPNTDVLFLLDKDGVGVGWRHDDSATVDGDCIIMSRIRGWQPLPPAGPVAPPRVSTGADLIAAERQRQMVKEGWTPEHDAEHMSGELAWAAVCYAAPKSVYVDGGAEPWPWAKEWDKRDKHDRQRRLVIAGALIAAEIDRLQRLAGPVAPKEPPDAPPAVPGPGSAGVPATPAAGADLAAPALSPDVRALAEEVLRLDGEALNWKPDIGLCLGDNDDGVGDLAFARGPMIARMRGESYEDHRKRAMNTASNACKRLAAAPALARALVGSDPDPRQGRPGGGDVLPEPRVVESAPIVSAVTSIDQPPPVENVSPDGCKVTSVEVWPKVIDDVRLAHNLWSEATPSNTASLIALINERNEVGIERYGTTLKTFNGRSAAFDALAECLDLTVYLRQWYEELAETADVFVLTEVYRQYRASLRLLFELHETINERLTNARNGARNKGV